MTTAATASEPHAEGPAIGPDGGSYGGSRLFAGVTSPGSGASLANHLRCHGPLPLDRPGARRARVSSARGASRASRASRASHGGVVDELARAGLTGRGGAAFPTATKVASVAAAANGALSRRPVVLANVMEGEPASRKDTTLAETVPHLLLDGAQVLASTLGASSVYVCVAAGADHDATARALEAAVAERAVAGVDPVPVTVARPPSGYVAGEESALTAWLDRDSALPAFRPDRPSIVRVEGRPALVENAETLAHVALIARYGADWFRSAGTPEAPGTALVTVSGAVSRPGVWEIAQGTPLSTVLHDAGAAPRLTGVLVGGYGGCWVPPSMLQVPLRPAPGTVGPPAQGTATASIGAGVVAAVPASSCGLAETARIVAWMAGESAGQCGPCVFGLPALADDLADLCAGRNPAAAMDRLHFRLAEVDGRGACRHPDLVVRLVRNALTVFAADLEHHLTVGPCHGTRATTVLPFPSR